MQFKRIKRRIDGVLLLDKPSGISSNQALQLAKRLFQAEKAGHTGSLDPLATGLLPICFGEATKFSSFLLDADKSYRALLKLGVTTTTGDAEGEVLERRDVRANEAQVKSVLQKFVGKILQTPPMYSALKHQGKPLYEYAREGIEIERKSREVQIHDISLQRFDQDEIEILVQCSKGTYIRTLAEDIGESLGCGSHLRGLRRLTTGHFDLKDALTLEALEAMPMEERDNRLLDVAAAISDLPEVVVDEASAHYLQQGQRIWKSGVVPPGLLRLYDEQKNFLGVGELMPDGRIAPRRLVKTN
ncbi:MAG TPA: tRNA pseudouridine(55) synthase TruB [Methylophilaceae bacterium]|nr:tRNA pseudouridine(55) synthase TruB [Methylophilaceae bacterium]